MCTFSGLIVPDDPNFNISDVRAGVGGRRMVDVMECKTQRALEMPMRDFERYFLGSDRTKIYNVISLEFSQSRLENCVKRPAVVDSLDWIDLVWPQHLKNIQTDQTNTLHTMKYPKVQKYCLMSVAGCYTDFHIDFGGTSVWYHILKGGKIFWLIPPTIQNLALFEKWTLSGRQGDMFLGDMVAKCQRIELEAGHSLMIPSGWIHAVYTPKDSLVFGGNFLNSFTIPMQLKISQLEERLKVPNRFRFPFFTDLLWYVLERYIHSLTGKSFLTEEFQEKNMLHTKLALENDNSVKEHVHLTPFEYEGLQLLLERLTCLANVEEGLVPEGIAKPNQLLSAGKELLLEHSTDDSNLAVTGKPKAYWPNARATVSQKVPKKRKPAKPAEISVTTTNHSHAGRARRVRCKQCEACLRADCRKCAHCIDMKKYGGPGISKKSCVKRKCTNPVFSSSSKFLNASDNNALNGTKHKSKKSRLDDSAASVVSVSGTNGESPLTVLPSVMVSRVSETDLRKYAFKSSDAITSSNCHPTLCGQLVLQHYEIAWIKVFKYLSANDLDNCRLVCKDFLGWSKSITSGSCFGITSN